VISIGELDIDELIKEADTNGDGEVNKQKRRREKKKQIKMIIIKRIIMIFCWL